MKNKKNPPESQDQKEQGFNDFLRDYKKSGKLRPWKKRKTLTDALAEACLKVPGLEKYGEKMCECGSYKEFDGCKNVKHGKTLVRANFCGYRLCVNCQSRKSTLIRKQVFDLATWHLEKHPTDIPILLTLTVPNVEGEEIGRTIDRMAKAYERLSKRKVVKRMTRSWFKSLEVTYNRDRDDFHPHFHILMMVPANYFDRKSGLYISRDEWLRLWQESMRDSTITQVDVRKVEEKGEGALGSIIAEVAKYATKPSSYIFEDEQGNFDVDRGALEQIHYGIKGRRLVGYGGYFKEVRKEKELLDVEKVKLDVKETEEMLSENEEVRETAPPCCKICNEPLVREAYRWDRVIKEYVRVYSDGDRGCEGSSSEVERVQCRGPT
jgi:plasmid rolling circle replication initiator protein Rep